MALTLNTEHVDADVEAFTLKLTVTSYVGIDFGINIDVVGHIEVHVQVDVGVDIDF